MGDYIKEKVVVGIIGAGGIATYHINGYMKAGAEVRAIADVNLKAVKSQALNYKIKHTCTSYKEMLEEHPDMNAVSICIPNKFHAEVTIDSLNRGKHVLCEKPPALNGKETLEMKQAAERNGQDSHV